MAELVRSERLEWLRLIRTESIGPVTFAGLIARFGSASRAIDILQNAPRKALKNPVKITSQGDAERELEKAERLGARLIASCDSDYPRLLAAAPAAPPLIYVLGHANLFTKPAVAIIGARNASAVGRRIARNLSEALGNEGFVITSGLARGIDGSAHEASLKTGTIGVVAGGIDVVYPPEHAELMDRIGAEGAIISEQPPGAAPTARDFPKRNRIISGLSLGVVVVEAAARSGTLITARYALEQGREVFAVPGSPLDPRCEGANRLIRDGATLVQNADDIIEVLARQVGVEEPASSSYTFEHGSDNAIGHEDSEQLRLKILEMLSFTPSHRDHILREISASPSQVIGGLVDLVISGEAEEHAGGYFSLRAL